MQDYNAARELLPALDPTSDEAAFLTAVTEYYHAPHNEKREHIVVLQSHANRGMDREKEARYLCVEWALELKDFELAQMCA